MRLINVNGVDLPTPSNYQVDIEPLENSKRNTMGTLLREIIAIKKKIVLEYKYLKQADYKILQEIRRLHSFSCNYWDTETEKNETITCYAGAIKGTPISVDDTGVTAWRDITVSFIEF